MSKCDDNSCEFDPKITNRGKFVLKCSECGALYPLSSVQTCFRCGHLLFWYPLNYAIMEGYKCEKS